MGLGTKAMNPVETCVLHSEPEAARRLLNRHKDVEVLFL